LKTCHNNQICKLLCFWLQTVVQCWRWSVLWYPMLLNLVFIVRIDCSIMVLKYMEHWEANKKYNGQSMPTYSGVSLMCKEENCSFMPWIEKLSSMYWVVHFLFKRSCSSFDKTTYAIRLWIHKIFTATLFFTPFSTTHLLFHQFIDRFRISDFVNDRVVYKPELN